MDDNSAEELSRIQKFSADICEHSRRVFCVAQCVHRQSAPFKRTSHAQTIGTWLLGAGWLAGFNTAHSNSDENGRVRLLNVVDQFLVAAKRFGISHLAFEEFSRQQSSLCLGDKTSNNATFYWLLPNDRSQRSSVILHLSSLNLDRSRLLQ